MSEGEHPDLALLDPRNRPISISLERAKVEVENAVYRATDLYERLEGAGLVWGNGHHMRQKIAKMASDLLEERWNEQKSDKKS